MLPVTVVSVVPVATEDTLPELVQSPPDTRSLTVIDEPRHMVADPPGVDGAPLTVTVVIDWQLPPTV